MSCCVERGTKTQHSHKAASMADKEAEPKGMIPATQDVNPSTFQPMTYPDTSEPGHGMGQNTLDAVTWPSMPAQQPTLRFTRNAKAQLTFASFSAILSREYRCKEICSVWCLPKVANSLHTSVNLPPLLHFRQEFNAQTVKSGTAWLQSAMRWQSNRICPDPVPPTAPTSWA